MKPHNLEETVVSEARGGSEPNNHVNSATEPEISAHTNPGSTSSPTDVTMLRNASSPPTVGDMPEPNNFGKYELLGEIARGGMGVVYRARQHGLDRLVALKMVLGSPNHESTQRFLQEARAAASLDHPNVVPIYDIGEIGNKPYFTMALVEGSNLRGFVDAENLPAIPVVVSVFAQIVAGVAHAHRHGIIHRDLKPANVLMDKDGRPRVTDFGLAKRATTDTALTATGQVVGTPQYMAPEQARESKVVGPQADVYSLGAILYFLLVGRAPFHGDSVVDLLLKVVNEKPESPRAARLDLPGDLESLCLKCLEKEPKDRFANADELLTVLTPILERFGTSATSLKPSVGSIGISGSKTTPSLPSAASVETMTPGSITAPMSVNTQRPESTGNRKLVVIGLSALALVLVAVIGVIAFYYKKPTEGVQQDPPPAENNPVPPPANGGDKFAWPALANNDFDLKVEMNAPGKQDKDGKILLHAGTAMSLRITAEKDCHVSVFVLDSTGHEEILFPNDDDTDGRFYAGKSRVIPSNGKYTLDTTPTEGNGVDRIRVLATTGKPISYPPGTKNGRFTFYTTEAERERLASTIRGVVIKKKSDTTPTVISEREIQFRVQK